MLQPFGARKQALQPLCLLLADDNPPDHDLVTRALSQHFGPVTVLCARDAHEFERTVASEEFDAAIVDHELRWITGTDALRAIRQSRPWCPVLMLAASGSAEAAVEAMKEGFDDCVTETAGQYARLPYALRACLERRAAERTSAQLSAIMDSSDDAIIGLGPGGLITCWNGGATRLLGYTADEIAGDSIEKIIPPELRDAEGMTLARVARGEHVDYYDTVRTAKDGRTIPVSVRLSPILDGHGRIIGSAKIVRDITERKRAEEALRLADKRKDAFLATLAHELRNPLAPIRYATRLLEPGVPPQMASDAKQMIDRQLAQMAHLLDDLLDVSRVTRGVLEICHEQLDLREIIENAVASAKSLAEAAHQELTVSLPPEPLSVSGDAVRLAQILGNLLHNATKYTPQGGRIAVAASFDGNEVIVSVKDNGIGIAPEVLRTIFELFVQLEAPGTRAAGGLGIGLSLARDLVRLHGGEIEAHSEGAGLGSEFIIRLPRIAEVPALTEAVAAPEKIAALGAAGVRVLIVDDNVDAATSLSYVLALAGYQTAVAHDGNRALELAEALRPAIVLLDIALPHLSGHDVARRLREAPWGQNLRLIAVTGWGNESDREKSLEAGFDAHLTKPIDPEMLLQHIALAARNVA